MDKKALYLSPDIEFLEIEYDIMDISGGVDGEGNFNGGSGNYDWDDDIIH